MKSKDKNKDRWISKIGAPYERVFSQRNNKVGYKGTKKIQFQAGIKSYCV